MKAGSSVAAGVVLVVQEYAAHCSKIDKFAQKLYYARCPLLGSKIRIHFFDLALFFGLLKAGSSVAAVGFCWWCRSSKMDRFVQKLKS